MALSSNDIQQLYIAYFNRPADPMGLRYWGTVPAGLDEVAVKAFGADPQFLQRYAGAGSKAVVKDLYHHLFGRAGDAAGVNYWSGLIDSAALEAAGVVLAMIRGAAGADREALANKAQLAQEWTLFVESTPGAIQAMQHDSIVPGMWLEQITDAASLPAARAAMPAMIQATYSSDALAVSGQALATGYLQQATVFIDSNHNGKQDSHELATRTDDNGHYTLVAPIISGIVPQAPLQLYDVLVTGGLDAATGRVHTGTQSVQALQVFRQDGKVVKQAAQAAVTPLGALLETLVAQGMTHQAAKARLASAFGIDAAQVTSDTLGAVLDADTGAHETALHAQAVNAQIDGVVAIMGRALMALSDDYAPSAHSTLPLPKPPSIQTVAAMKGLAAAIAGKSGALALDDAQTILQVLDAGAAAISTNSNSAVQKALAALDAPGKAAFGAIVAEAAGAAMQGLGNGVDMYDALAHIAQVRAVLSTIGDVLPGALASHQAATKLPHLSGAALSALIGNTSIIDLDPFSHNDDAAIARANAGGPVQHPQSVEQLYVALLGRPAGAAELAAGMAQDSATLATRLAASQEFPSGLSTVQHLDRIYVNAFGRHADTDGLLYWASLVTDKTLDLLTAARSIASGAAGSDAVALHSKTLAATELSAMLAWEQYAAFYDNANGHAIGKAWLATVLDGATLDAAIAQPPLLRVVAVASAPMAPVEEMDTGSVWGWL